MIKLRNISIRNKLVLMQVLTSVIVLGTLFAVYIVTDLRSYKQRKADNMLSLAQVIAASSASSLEFQDNDEAKKILTGLHQESPDISYAGIVDKRGKIFASYADSNAAGFRMPPVLNIEKSAFSGNYLFVRSDIYSQKEYLGRVVFAVNLLELRQIKQYKYRIGFILLVVALAFSFLIALAVQALISKRLYRLVNTMKEVSETNNYDKSIGDDGKDEISTLINVFNKMMRQIDENLKRKDEFLGIVSHELKTPLTSIKGYLELLSEIENEEPNRQLVIRGLDSVKKLEKLINDLLDVSKIQSGQLELDLSEFNIDQLIDETIEATKMIFPSHQIIRENYLGNEIVLADRHRIEQVIANLLSNAIKYSPGERKVIVSGTKTDSEIIIKIKDFGIGVPGEEQSNIFERFYRSRNVSMTIVGFGLGLYICRDIVHRHHGKIWMETEEKGSAFYFSLPTKKIAHISELSVVHASVPG